MLPLKLSSIYHAHDRIASIGCSGNAFLHEVWKEQKQRFKPSGHLKSRCCLSHLRCKILRATLNHCFSLDFTLSCCTFGSFLVVANWFLIGFVLINLFQNLVSFTHISCWTETNWGVAKGSSISWVAKFYREIKLLLSPGKMKSQGDK